MGTWPYTSVMATQDDLRRCAESAAALLGGAAARAKQVAELLLGSRERAGEQAHKAEERAHKKAESLVEDGRRAAADALVTLRREDTGLGPGLEPLGEE